MNRHTIKTILVFLLYLSISLPFVTLVNITEMVKALPSPSCDSFRAVDAEKYPTIAYCKMPVGPGGPHNDTYYYIVYVSGLSSAIDHVTFQATINNVQVDDRNSVIENPTQQVVGYWLTSTHRINVISNGTFILDIRANATLKLIAEENKDYTIAYPVDECGELAVASIAASETMKSELVGNFTKSFGHLISILTAVPLFLVTSWDKFKQTASPAVPQT